MIGFFQNSMAKHHRLVFGVLLVFIVVSFVFYTGSGSAADLLGIRRSSTVMGVDLNSSEDVAPYRAGVALNSGGQFTVQDVVQRIFLVKMAESYQIPEPTQKQLSSYLSDQGLSSEAINAIIRQNGISEETLRTSIIHSWKVGQLLQTFGNVPAIFESDVDLVWKEMNTRWTVEFAQYPKSAVQFVDRLPKNAEEAKTKLLAYYDENKEDFRIDELVNLSFAKIIPETSDLSKIPEPTDFELKTYVSEKIGDNGEKLTAELKNNRAARVAEWKKMQAIDLAAAEISNTLYEKLPTDGMSPRYDDFSASLEKSKLGFIEIAAFPKNSVPQNTPVPAEILQSAVGGLNDTLWRTDAIPVNGAIYVVVFRGTNPSRIPAFEEVESEVLTAWQLADQEEQFLSLVREKGTVLEKAVKDGGDFLKLAAEQGFKTSKPDAFTPQRVPEEFNTLDLIGLLKNLPEKSISPMLRFGENAVFATVVSKSTPAIDKNSEDFKQIWQSFDRQMSWETLQAQLIDELTELNTKLGLNRVEQE